jgi:hypothetical protein
MSAAAPTPLPRCSQERTAAAATCRAVPRARSKILAQAAKDGLLVQLATLAGSTWTARAAQRLRERLLAHMQAHEPKPDFPLPREYRASTRTAPRCGLQLYQATGVSGATSRRPIASAGRTSASSVPPRRNREHRGVAWVCTALSIAGRTCRTTCWPPARRALPASRRRRWPCIRSSGASSSRFGPDRRVVCGISVRLRGSRHHRQLRFAPPRAPVAQVAHWLE